MTLICAFCGRKAPARKQWWNRDTGYGCCHPCWLDHVERFGRKEAQESCGIEGIHHSICPVPELLEALKEYLAAHSSTGPCKCRTCEAARNAIATTHQWAEDQTIV